MIEIEINEDIVYAVDLEKTIEYSILTEIGSQPELNTLKLHVLYRWIEALTKYVSMRAEIWSFLSAIKEWMSQSIVGSSVINGNEMSDKLNELSNRYNAFQKTPKEWRGKMEETYCILVIACNSVYIW